MANPEQKLPIGPVELEWLAHALKVEEYICPRPALESLLDSLPSALYLYPPGVEIMLEGDKGSDFFVIYKGKLSAWRTKGLPAPKHLGDLLPGDFFGEIGFLLNSPRSATVKTETECRLFKFKAEEFRQLFERHEKLKYLIKHVAWERVEKIFLDNL